MEEEHDTRGVRESTFDKVRVGEERQSDVKNHSCRFTEGELSTWGGCKYLRIPVGVTFVISRADAPSLHISADVNSNS